MNDELKTPASELTLEVAPEAPKGRAALVNLMHLTPEATGMNRSTDQVSREMRAYVDDGRISDEDLTALVWLFVHAKERDMNFEATGKLVGYSSATMSRLFAGKYIGSVEDVVSKVKGYRKICQEREKMSQAMFVETSIWDRVKSVLDLAIYRNAPVRISGPSQIGKTASMLEYKRRSDFNVFYARVPAAPSFRNFLEAIAESVGVNVSLRTEELRRRIPGALNKQTLLMVDELHELALSAGRGTVMKCMEWLREIWDVSHCGLAVCGTRSMEDDLINGAGLKGWLDQFDQRCIRRLELPNRLPASDIALTADAYGFPPPDNSVENILGGIRMNRLCVVFQMASALARKKGMKKSWELFSAVYDKNFREAS